MPDRSLEVVCNECGRSLALERWEARPVRCEPCFEAYLRGIDLDFLASYGELGVTSRRAMAETCLPLARAGTAAHAQGVGRRDHGAVSPRQR